MSTFSTMKNNVSNDIQDTTSAMASRIGRYLNRRYQQVLRAINWDYIDEDYTQSITAGTQDYSLPDNFKHEVYVVDKTNDRELKRVSLDFLGRYYPGDITTGGTVRRYAIYKSDDGSTYIKLHYNPDSSLTLDMPYHIKPVDMSADTDEPVIEVSHLLERGARADAYRYKRQYGKANAEESLFTKELTEYVWEKESTPNFTRQFQPNTFDRDDIV